MNLWNECQKLIHKDELWDGTAFFNNVEKEINDVFNIRLERKGGINYTSSSIFLGNRETSLMRFYK